MDRMDLCVELQPVELRQLQKGSETEKSETIRQRVLRAREIQTERFAGSGKRFNADMEPSDLERYCILGQTQKKCMEELFVSLQLSARGYH